jgi:hypothetical protein
MGGIQKSIEGFGAGANNVSSCDPLERHRTASMHIELRCGIVRQSIPGAESSFDLMIEAISFVLNRREWLQRKDPRPRLSLPGTGPVGSLAGSQ